MFDTTLQFLASPKQAYFLVLFSIFFWVTTYVRTFRFSLVCLQVSRVFWCRRERHWRVALFFGEAALAGAFGGMLFRLVVPITVVISLCHPSVPPSSLAVSRIYPPSSPSVTGSSVLPSHRIISLTPSPENSAGVRN